MATWAVHVPRPEVNKKISQLEQLPKFLERRVSAWESMSGEYFICHLILQRCRPFVLFYFAERIGKVLE